MTTPPEGFHPDPKGDNCRVCIEGVYVTVAQLASLYQAAIGEILEDHRNVAEPTKKSFQDWHKAMKRHEILRVKAGLGPPNRARKEAGL